MKAWWVALVVMSVLVLQAGAEPPASGLHIGELDFPQFRQAPQKIKSMLSDAAALTRKKLSYLYGVADPERGFDCSGFVFHLLLKNGAPNVPRQANTLYEYLDEKGALHEADDEDELGELEPGDLLFWTGTYDIDRSVTHVMIYLGKDSKTGKRWMIGAAGRKYGIGVFQFRVGEGSGLGEKFIGYGKTSAFFPDLMKLTAPSRQSVGGAWF